MRGFLFEFFGQSQNDLVAILLDKEVFYKLIPNNFNTIPATGSALVP